MLAGGDEVWQRLHKAERHEVTKWTMAVGDAIDLDRALVQDEIIVLIRRWVRGGLLALLAENRDVRGAREPRRALPPVDVLDALGGRRHLALGQHPLVMLKLLAEPQATEDLQRAIPDQELLIHVDQGRILEVLLNLLFEAGRFVILAAPLAIILALRVQGPIALPDGSRSRGQHGAALEDLQVRVRRPRRLAGSPQIRR
mmetsp:Transcript_174452/g.559220  ORF Transcript_174452/g.559220 Transcript_174452/m.559220 type:complete len:200 (-) Transcript_174452:1296-1895(-)